MQASMRYLTPPEVEARREQVLRVYREAFALPPYNETGADVSSFAEALSRHTRRQGFRLVAAVEGQDGPLLGFAYGYTSAPGQWWHDLVARAMDPALAAEWLGDAFEFVELAVAPQAQGRGLGGRLHDALLAGLPHQRAVLSTMQAETVALRLYRRRGWVVLLEGFRFPNVARPYLVLGLDLTRSKAVSPGSAPAQAGG